MRIGVPKEIKTQEFRVGMTPSGVATLVARGHQVTVEQNAGQGSAIPDEAYIKAGAKIAATKEQIWGENDMVVNPCVKKHLTNMRASGSDFAIKLTPPREMTLEASIEWIEDDELIEVTPKSVRLRKRILDHSQRKVSEKRAVTVEE